MKDLSVITVTHHSAPYIETLVSSVVTGGVKSSIEHWIVDNHSTDGTCEVLDSMMGVKVIKNQGNMGFSAANNQAARAAEGRYLLFLNPDMRVQEGSLDVMVEWMDNHPEVGICSCALVDGRGEEMKNPMALPRWGREVIWLLGLERWLKEVPLGEVEMVKGAFMMVRKEIVEHLGYAFDPRYFLLFEDADLCREAKRLGFEIACLDSVKCVDFNSRSFSLKTGEWIYRHYTDSMLRYFRKWEPWYRWMVIAMLIPVGRGLRVWR